MYTMKQACEKTGLAYETLKFYCNQGLVPNVKRDKQNRRVFDDRDIAWINSLNCLKKLQHGHRIFTPIWITAIRFPLPMRFCLLIPITFVWV